MKFYEPFRLKYISYGLWILLSLSCKNSGQSSSENTKADQQPNIIMIVADDLGWYDLACYGNPFIESPNIDQLAKEGILFTNAYAAAPLCSPSRASLITGLHPIRVNITEHIHGNHPAKPEQKLKTPPIAQQLNLKYKTLAEALKARNYNTAFIGKWHLGGGKFKPNYQGFDINIAGAWNGLPKSFFYPFFNDGEKPELQNTSKEGDYLTDVLTDKAITYIQQQKDNHFFLSLDYYAPHVPIEAKKNWIEKYRKKRKDTSKTMLPNIHYAAMISTIDENVGRIVRQIKTLGIEDNTLIIFTSDNGGLSVQEIPFFAKHTPPTDNGHLRAGKGYLYEGGIRVPLIIKWPGKIAAGQRNDTPVIGQDLFNTCQDLSGGHHTTADGKSLLPIFNGGDISPRGLLWHSPHYSPQHDKPASAYREGNWKIIHFYEDDRYELYSLKEDPSEGNDLAQSEPEKLNLLKQRMSHELQALQAQYPESNPNYTQ